MKFIARHAGEDIPIEVERLASGYRVRTCQTTRFVAGSIALNVPARGCPAGRAKPASNRELITDPGT